MSGPDIADRASDDVTQNGEDQLLRSILAKLPPGAGWIVEFGAWDGLHLSNSYSFIHQDGWSAVLIEGDAARAKDLERNYRDNEAVHTFHRLVGWNEDEGLDSILSTTPIPKDFDVLSVDIDGNDYHVWEAVRHYRPRAVVIEFNQTMPNAVDFVQPADASLTQGSSLRALTRLAADKGYELAGTTRFNAIFVTSELFPSLGIADNSIQTLHDEQDVTYLFSGYDGQVFVAGTTVLPWHGLPIDARRLQVLPKAFRRFPQSFSRRRLAAFYLYKAWVTVRSSPDIATGLRRAWSRRRVG